MRLQHQYTLLRFIALFALLLSFTSGSFGQSKRECRKLLKKKIQPFDIKEDPIAFFKDYETLLKCECDTSDLPFLTISFEKDNNTGGSVLLQVLMSIAEKADPKEGDNFTITFSDLSKELHTVISSDGFKEMKVSLLKVQAVERIVPDIKNWQQDSARIDSIGTFSTEEFSLIKEMVASGSFSSYKSLLREFKEETIIRTDSLAKVRMDSLYMLGKEDVLQNITAYTDFSKGLEQAKKSGKPALVFFTGYGCVNAREMEATVLTDYSITDLINSRFEFIFLLVDDRTQLDPHEVYTSTTSNEKITSVGKLNLDIETTRFQVDTQPFFAIMNPDGSVFATSGYTLDTEVFKQFLLSYFGE